MAQQQPPQPSRHARELAGGIANIMGQNVVPVHLVTPVDSGVAKEEQELAESAPQAPNTTIPPPPNVPPTREPTGEEAARLLPTYKELVRLSREQLHMAARRLTKLTEREDQMADARIIDYEITNLAEAGAQYAANYEQYDRLWRIYQRSDASPLG